MNSQAALQKAMQKSFLDLQAKNPSFSLRAYAKKLGLSPSATSELLRGYRRASRKLAERIAKRLLLDPQEMHQILKGFEDKAPRKKAGTPQQTLDEAASATEYLRLTADQFQLISEWIHYAVLSLIKTHDFKSDPEWIAQRLGVTASKVASCIERLERLGLIERSPEGELTRTVAQIHTPDDVFNVSLQKAHLADMEIAKDALANVPVELRDFTSISMPTSPELMPKMKQLIRRFREEAAELMTSAPKPTEVYQMSVYLYPLTQVRTQNPKPKVRK